MPPSVSTGDQDAIVHQVRWSAAVQTPTNCHCQLEKYPVMNIEPVKYIMQYLTQAAIICKDSLCAILYVSCISGTSLIYWEAEVHRKTTKTIFGIQPLASPRGGKWRPCWAPTASKWTVKLSQSLRNFSAAGDPQTLTDLSVTISSMCIFLQTSYTRVCNLPRRG